MNDEESTTALLARARAMLEATAKTPSMYAPQREALIMRVSTILEIFVPNFHHGAFYAKHLGVRGSTYTTLDAPADDQWARAMIQDALALLT